MKMLHISIVSAIGAGFAKFAPGTWGTLVGSIIVYIVWQLGGLTSPWTLVFMTLGVSIIGYYSITKLPNSWVHDDQRIVIDEVVGLWATLIWIPINWKTLILSFVLFRLYDIFKPLGIRKFDNMDSDIGVIVDDLLAGVYANLTLRLVIVALSAYELW